ncbi:unnamed protein product [Didymodactylos carnosus]|uniref:NAD(P)(+)--arginine ADP-ribosyltransferase n=1 Tax=Didymodactylos carnosus TaxID=1234261 RepID=A0A814V6F9_9BILA|nr:unnamed protein product [Didymodactylos carnosus]CAF3949254.1 unnamed protein product [Didymodactylos carnosus]
MSLRIQRFAFEEQVLSLSNSDTYSEAEWIEKSKFLDEWDYCQWEAEHWLFCTNQKVEKAAQGIVIEGEKLGGDIYMNQANEIADLLMSVANNDFTEIQKFCFNLYTRETFLYKLINKVLSNRDTTKVNTLGPFCSILNRSFVLLSKYRYTGIVYRGILLSSEQVKLYQQARGIFQQWDSFVSTTKNRNMANIYGNTLFIITIDGLYVNGLDISSFSNFPEEEEVLIPPGRTFSIDEIKFNTVDDKYHVHISMCY